MNEYMTYANGASNGRSAAVTWANTVTVGSESSLLNAIMAVNQNPVNTMIRLSATISIDHITVSEPVAVMLTSSSGKQTLKSRVTPAGSYPLVMMTDPGSQLFIEQITLSDNNNTLNPPNDGTDRHFPGGAIFSNGEVTIGNQASIVRNKSTYGGGVFVTSSGKFIMQTNSEIANNEALYGGGGVFTTADIELLGGTVKNNISGGDGGGMQIGGIARYPIGFVWQSTNATNPAQLFGYGTWAPFAEGRVLIGENINNTVGGGTVPRTGGAKTHTLTVSEMPRHTHNGQGYWTKAGSGKEARSRGVISTDPQDASSALLPAGGGQAHNNLPPYTVVYMFIRTA